MGNAIINSRTQPADIGEITLLFNIVNPRHSRNVLYWQWSNYDTPFGKSLSMVAKKNNQVIAHYSIMPMDFFMGGQRITAGFGQQAVVHKKFRNLMIMKDLTDLIFEKAKLLFPYIYAFPNDNLFFVKKRLLGWQEINVFYADIIHVNGLKVSKSSAVEVRKLEAFPEIDWFEDNTPYTALRKTSDYLNWRFINHPVNHYIVLGGFHKNECIGYLVLKVYMGKEDNSMMGHFVDFDSKEKDESVLRSLIFEAQKIFKFYNIEEIVFWNKEVNFKKMFQKFITGRGFKTNMAALIYEKNIAEAVLNKENWSFTMAASDAF